LDLDEEGAAVDRKKHTPAHKKMYKKHHKIRGSLVLAIPRAEYMKMSDKSTTKAMFASLSEYYEGSKKAREAKALMLIHQYELFKMKDDESIEEMYSRFQTLFSGLQILKKNYVASDHVSKILRSLPARWRPKVSAIEEAKDLNSLSVKDLVSSLKVREISLNEHEPAKKSKSICHTLILDLKILIPNSFLFLILFNSQCFTLQFSTVLQLHIFTISVFSFLAYKAIQSAFLALQVI